MLLLLFWTGQQKNSCQEEDGHRVGYERGVKFTYSEENM
jgi:hypothetical protein